MHTPLETVFQKQTITFPKFTDDSFGFRGTKSVVASAVSLKPLCLSEERTKGSASSPSPSLALEEGRLDSTVLERKETMPNLVRVSPKQTHKATQATHLG